MKKTREKLPGFDVRNMDTRVRPQDDFYHFANGGWLKNNKIPHTESRWGSFVILRYEAEKNLKRIVDFLLAHKSPKKGSTQQLVGDLYRSGMDMQKRNALGIQPLALFRKKIGKISDRKDLLATIAYFHRLGISAPWGAGVDLDSKNSKKYVLHLYQSGLGLPDRDYYLKDTPEFVRVRSAYSTHVRTIFKLLGYTPAEAAAKTRVVMNVETLLAKVSMDKVDVRDAEKTYHKKTLAQLAKYAPTIDWRKYFKAAGIPRVPYVITTQPDFLKATSILLHTLLLKDWKVYLEWHVTDSVSSLLSDSFVKANFRFSQVLSGSKKIKPPWRRILAVVNGTLGEQLGKIYVAKYFDQEKKHKMDALVSDLFAVYEERIKNLDWMSAGTKRKAVAKLRLMGRKIGYPKKWRSYAGLVISSSDYFGNIMRITRFEHRRELKKLKRKSIDREEWYMYPQTVNAYCNFNMNEIVFPAAILQPPFFNFSADDAFNYGGIGAVIGHEMTHGFDDQGAKFDGNGNMKTWWSQNDKKRFEAKGTKLAKQYSAFKVTGGISVNGQLTLGENIADLGGLVIGFDAYQKHVQESGRRILAGFTPEQRFFLGFAQAERELTRSEFEKTHAITNHHSPPVFRINGPLAHFTPFYEAFGITKKDKLYRDPKLRAHIW